MENVKQVYLNELKGLQLAYANEPKAWIKDEINHVVNVLKSL